MTSVVQCVQEAHALEGFIITAVVYTSGGFETPEFEVQYRYNYVIMCVLREEGGALKYVLGPSEQASLTL